MTVKHDAELERDLSQRMCCFLMSHDDEVLSGLHPQISELTPQSPHSVSISALFAAMHVSNLFIITNLIGLSDAKPNNASTESWKLSSMV
jgi:hypothetical protein